MILVDEVSSYVQVGMSRGWGWKGENKRGDLIKKFHDLLRL